MVKKRVHWLILLRPLSPSFLELLDRRNGNAQELDDDRRRDVGHDAQGKNGCAGEGASSEEGKMSPKPPEPSWLHLVCKHIAVHTWEHNEGAQAVHQNQAERHAQLLAQLLVAPDVSEFLEKPHFA